MRKPMRTVVVVLLAAGLGVSSAFLASCGDRNSLIPPSDAAAMRSELDQASTLYVQQECRKAEAKVASARSRADRLPPEVDSNLRTTLAQNIDSALSRVSAQCGKTTTTATTATTSTPATTATHTTPSTHTQPHTTPPPTTSTSDTGTTPTPSTPQSTPGGSGGTPPSNSGGAGG